MLNGTFVYRDGIWFFTPAPAPAPAAPAEDESLNDLKKRIEDMQAQIAKLASKG